MLGSFVIICKVEHESRRGEIAQWNTFTVVPSPLMLPILQMEMRKAYWCLFSFLPLLAFRPVLSISAGCPVHLRHNIDIYWKCYSFGLSHNSGICRRMLKMVPSTILWFLVQVWTCILPNFLKSTQFFLNVNVRSYKPSIEGPSRLYMERDGWRWGLFWMHGEQASVC